MTHVSRSVLVFFLGALGLGFSSGAFAALPAGFVDELVTAATGPTAIDFTPDGRLLIARQTGELIVRQGTTNTSAVTFPASQLCSNFERGLLGVAVDPNFGPGAGQNRFIYLFYTFHKVPALACTSTGSSVNRVSRFVLSDANTVDLATETILVDNMPSTAGNHNAGDVQFGKDGYLYITIGDGGSDYNNDSGSAGANDASRDQYTLTGKVLRITKDGGIPPTNPFQGAGTARCNVTGTTTPGNKCQETYSWGHRNPFRIAFDPNVAGTRFFINDVGQNVREEIDLGTAGADFGWNCREGTRVNSTTGPCNPTPPNMVPPIFEYAHGVQVPGSSSSTSCNSITGGAFVPNGIWPASFDNAYLFSDYVCGWIFTVAGANTNGPFTTAADFATNLGGSSAVALRFGPYLTTQALYYTTFAAGGQVRRVRYSPVAGNNPPTASISANPISGLAPLTVNFDGSASTDPDAGNTLTYFWTFGDGTVETSTTTPTTSHTYAANGDYPASLRVRDNNFAFSPPATQTIQVGNTPPSASIVSPTSADRFVVGQTITLNGFATDGQDGPFPDSSLGWTVRLHHNEHTHPLFSGNGNNLQFVAPAPEDVFALDSSYLEIDLMVTDQGGLTGSDHLDFQPNRVATSFSTDPPGLVVTINGEPITGPTTINAWQAWTMNVNAPSPQISGGTSYGFTSWTDGGAQSHSIVTTATPSFYTASFTPLGPASLDYFTVAPCRLVDTRNANGPYGGPILSANSTRTFVATGQCNVPLGAQAVAVNLTVVNSSSVGSLTLGPAGSPHFPSVSAINFSAGQVRTNNAVVTLSAGGAFYVFPGLPSGTTHAVIDVVGYFQ